MVESEPESDVHATEPSGLLTAWPGHPLFAHVYLADAGGGANIAVIAVTSQAHHSEKVSACGPADESPHPNHSFGLVLDVGVRETPKEIAHQRGSVAYPWEPSSVSTTRTQQATE